MHPLPLNPNRSQRRRWLRAVRKSTLQPEAKQVAGWVAASTDAQGVITDPLLVQMLEDLEAGNDGQ